MQRMQQILKMKQEAEAKKNKKVPSLADKIEMLMNVLLQPDALAYMNQIKQRNITVYNQIKTEFFPDEVISQIDLLMQYYSQGLIQRGIISLTEIQILERQYLGVSSSITVKRQGDRAKDLTSFLKEKK
jgi:hypothetical protein